MNKKRPDNLTAHTITAFGAKRISARSETTRSEKKPKASMSRPDLAAEFGKLFGEIVDVCWGVGSQQVRLTTTGTVVAVEDTFVKLQKPNGAEAFIPFFFYVRHSQ